METNEATVVNGAEVVSPPVKRKRKAKAVARSKMAKNPKRKKGTAKAADKMSHVAKREAEKHRKLEANMEELARMLILLAKPEINKVEIASRIGVNHGTVYRWTDERPRKKPFPIPLPTAALIVIKAKHRIARMGNKRDKSKAESLLVNVTPYLEEKL